MMKIQLKVSGMSCGHCKMSVEKVLKELGASEVNVDLESGSVQISYDESTTTEEMIVNSIEEAGYTVIRNLN